MTGTGAGSAAGGTTALAFSPGGGALAAGGPDGTVLRWDVTDPGHPVPLGTLTGPGGAVLSAAFSPDGTSLAAGTADGKVWLWQVATPDGQPESAALTATLAAAQNNGQNTGQGNGQGSTGGDVSGVAFAPSGGQLAAADGSSVRLFAATPAAASAAVCANLGQPLTPAEWAGYLPGVAYHTAC